MYLLYSILLVSWGILLIPFLIYRAWRHKKYVPGLPQRFGRLPGALKSDGRPTIWFHACSVGETLSLEPLVSSLHTRFPEARFVFSTITKTGQLMAAQHFARYGEGNTFFFPVDLASICKRVLGWIQPGMIVIIDTEIWPNLIHQAGLRGIPVVLANGRISTASFRHYRWAKPVLRKIFRNYTLLMMQSEEDAQRIQAIGAPSEKIVVTGNMKFDKSFAGKEANEKIARDLDACFCNQTDGQLIVAGSTHEGEEQVLLEALQRVRKTEGLGATRLLLAPRHPERFEDVAGIILHSGFRLRRRTTASSGVAEVYLLDTLGELAAVYQLATVVFVGGTLDRHGGHSIMEPASYAKPIVVGPSMENFREIMTEFIALRGIRQISADPGNRELQVEQLTHVFTRLLQDENERERLGKAALSILEKNRGAARATAERVAAIFERAQHLSGTQPARTARL